MGLRPNFLILGANKAGTSSLHIYLAQHPDIFMPENKEPTFFPYLANAIQPAKGNPGLDKAVTNWEDYEALFADAGGFKIRGESSTAYLHNPAVPPLIKEHLPDVKMVAVFREPADRAFSNYTMYRRWNIEPLRTFKAALKAEPKRLADGMNDGYGYTTLGFYADRVEQYLSLFPHDRFRFFLFDDIKHDAAAVAREIFEFLDIDPDVPVDASKRYNVNTLTRSQPLDTLLQKQKVKKLVPNAILQCLHNLNTYKPQLSPQQHRELQDLYREDIKRLAKLIDRDLTHWLNPR
ncbi:MAG: sulfotransferase domain-containing protein [Planctomycetota bacterium]